MDTATAIGEAKPASDALIEVRLTAIRFAARDTNIFEFRRPDGQPLPPYEPGAHVDVHLPSGHMRSRLVMLGLVVSLALGGCTSRPAPEPIWVGQLVTLSGADGGLLNLKRSAGICEAAGLPVVKHSLGELGVALAAATHVLAATPTFRYANQAYGALLADDITAGFGGPAGNYRDGCLDVPAAPGRARRRQGRGLRRAVPGGEPELLVHRRGPQRPVPGASQGLTPSGGVSP